MLITLLQRSNGGGNYEWPENPVIFFDGVCNFCNASVNFVIDHDPAHRFRFAALQSEVGQRLMARYNEKPISLQTIILLEAGSIYYKSDAVLHIARHLTGWAWLYAGRWLPTTLRDGIYDFVARHRYRILGKRETCRMPTDEEKMLFLY